MLEVKQVVFGRGRQEPSELSELSELGFTANYPNCKHLPKIDSLEFDLMIGLSNERSVGSIWTAFYRKIDHLQNKQWQGITSI